MRYLVLGDIHSNIDALECVLDDAARHQADRVVLLGDLVGYGASPNEVIARLRALAPATAVRGNHDKAALTLDEAEGFNVAARFSARWTFGTLTDVNKAYLAALPQGPQPVGDGIECCHGTPFDEDAYVFDEMDALYALQASSARLCLYGHTHIPAALAFDGSVLDYGVLKGDHTIDWRYDWRYLVNVGSVGQPRDGDPRAAYGVVDTEQGTVSVCRVTYPVEQAQAKIIAAGLPEVLAQRLRLGR
jgi:predicted phosphodiesterase